MAISIDIGTRNFHMVMGQVSGHHVKIDRMVMETLPTGIIQDGIIRDYNGIETALKNMLSVHKIKDRNCIITINGTHIYTREFEVPKTAPKALKSVVAFEVQNSMNSNKDVVVEYVASKQALPDKPTMLHVRASAIQTEYVLEYGKLLRNLKLKPVALDIHANAITKLLNGRTINNAEGDHSKIMIIDIGYVTSTAYVIVNSEIAYSRIIPIGTIDIERYVVNQSNQAVADRQFSLGSTNLSLGVLRMNSELGDAVRPMILALTDGVNRIQQYLSGRIQGSRIDRIYIYGRGSTFEGLEETLSESMKIQIDRVKTISGVSLPSGIEPAPYLNAIGAMIRMKS